MKTTIMLACVLLASALAKTSMAQLNEPSQAGPSCGTEQAMAKMPAQLKSLTAAAALAVQSDELLLYINFNQNGSLVRQGFGNAETLTSSIVQGTRFCPAPMLDQTARDEIVKLVSDDFSPFNIKVTTDASEFAAYPRFNKQMVLVTTEPSVIGQSSEVGGVAPFFSVGFRLPGDLAFVFSARFANDPQDVAAVVSHEAGHLLGLGHQHLFTYTCGFSSEYHPGFGSGPLSFDPLMGDALGDGINNWFAQDCLGPNSGVRQNDYQLINSQVSVRPDDFPDEPDGGVIDANDFSGILERAGDVDLIGIPFRDPGPVVITSGNIDLKVSLVNRGGQVMAELDDPDGTSVTIPFAAGMRYLKIEAAGNQNMPARFMTGTYFVSY